MNFIPASCKIRLGILDTVEVLHLWLFKEKDVPVPDSCSFIHSTILIHHCFIWVVEEWFFFRYRDSPAGLKHRQLGSRKKSDLGHKKHCLAAPRVSSLTIRLSLHDAELELIISCAKLELAVHSTRRPDSSWLYIPVVCLEQKGARSQFRSSIASTELSQTGMSWLLGNCLADPLRHIPAFPELHIHSSTDRRNFVKPA